jgi:hypothetical protein
MLEGEMSTDEAAAKLERVMLEKGISSSSIVGHDLPVRALDSFGLHA